VSRDGCAEKVTGGIDASLAPATVTLTAAEVRPQGAVLALSPLTMSTLTPEDVASRTRAPLRTVQRWFTQWHDRGWPTVLREKRPGDSRWRVRVRADEFAAWQSGEAPPAKSA
jgi:hypothetical protein